MSKKHGPEPFYRPRRKRWYVEINGKHINLGPDEDQAKVRWHQIMGGAVPITATDPATSPSTSVLVCQVIDRFVEWSHNNRPPRTAEWYHAHLQSFLDSLPDAATLSVDQLRPFHATNWTDAHPSWGPNYKRGDHGRPAAFSWAERQGHVDKNPVRGCEKPAPVRREQFLTPINERRGVD